MGNTGLSRIAGIGDICLKFDTGMELVLHNVKHVPDMRLNIISTGLLDEDGYQRLGHMSEKGMSILSKKNVLSDVHDINLKKCSHCLETLGGCSYFVTFIDDHSRKGRNLNVCDNGGEYIGPFDVYCREHGIQHQKTPPKTPQLNGLAERMNRTLVERVRCLLSHVGVWSGKDVSYHHLRVFRCKASVHIPKDEKSKLDMKNKPCVFRGYGQDELGYRLYDPVQKKLVRS
ncbi:putative RNA-directed DNA polymerase [Tanacetum coccineum]